MSRELQSPCHCLSDRKIKASPIEKKIELLRKILLLFIENIMCKVLCHVLKDIINLSHMCECLAGSVAQKMLDAGFTWTYNVHQATLNTLTDLYM